MRSGGEWISQVVSSQFPVLAPNFFQRFSDSLPAYARKGRPAIGLLRNSPRQRVAIESIFWHLGQAQVEWKTPGVVIVLWPQLTHRKQFLDRRSMRRNSPPKTQ